MPIIMYVFNDMMVCSSGKSIVGGFAALPRPYTINIWLEVPRSHYGVMKNILSTCLVGAAVGGGGCGAGSRGYTSAVLKGLVFLSYPPTANT